MAKLNGKDIFFSPRITMTVDVDKHYDPESDNAQSGKAVAEAVSVKQDTLVSGANIKTVNGESLLGDGDIDTEQDLSDYVKNTDYATANVGGVIKTGMNYGLSVSTGGFERIVPATNAAIDSRTPADILRDNTAAGTNTNQFRNPITPANIDYAVKKVLTDNKTTFTSSEQITAKNKLGITEVKYSSTDYAASVNLSENHFYYIYGEEGDAALNLIIPKRDLFNTVIFWQVVDIAGAGVAPQVNITLPPDASLTWFGEDVTNGTFNPQYDKLYKIEIISNWEMAYFAKVTRFN